MAKRSAVTSASIVAQAPGQVTVGLGGSDYQLRLRLDAPLRADRVGQIRGVMQAKALKVDAVGAGGLFIEPVYGRPRRVQGRVLAADSLANTLTVQGPCVVVAQLADTQRATEFPAGGLVAFNVQDGSRWVPSSE